MNGGLRVSRARMSPGRSAPGGRTRAATASHSPRPWIPIQRRGLILPVVLVLVGLLAMTIGGFIFFIRAETAGSIAHSTQQQAWLAAQSALEDAVATLRANRHSPAAWFDVPGRWRNALVYSPAYTRDGDPVRQQGGSRVKAFEREVVRREAWRYSLVGMAVGGVEDTFRYGVTPEAGKLNINTASEAQIAQLLLPLLADLGVENPQEVLACVLDWIDSDSDAREGGAEDAYYNTLTPPYRAKNGPLDTIEELLLVKHFNAIVLYGEDVNRNGILDANENDGDASPPLFDNRDGNLDRGLAPFITTWSREPDTALDNKPRINLALNAGAARALIAEQIPDGALSDATIQFITGLQQQGIDVTQLGSPALLFPLPEGEVYELPPGFGQPAAGAGPRAGEQDDGKSGEAPPMNEEPESPTDDGASAAAGRSDAKDSARTQSRNDQPEKGDDPAAEEQGLPPGADDKQLPPPARGGRGGGPPPPLGADGMPLAGGPGQPGGAGPPNLEALRASPVTLEELPILMDRFTVRRDAGAEGIRGLININTADPRVLALIPGITPEAIAGIVQTRTTLPPDQLQTTAWPLVSQAVDTKTFQQIAPFITAKAYQFHVEALGYADHAKIAKRCEWIIEMIGPVPQVKYYRDLTSLGMAWPIDREQVTVTTR